MVSQWSIQQKSRIFSSHGKVRKIPGVGAKTEQALLELKIETVKDLASMKPEVLTKLFGTWGARLHEFANGIDNREVIEEYETKSIGRDTTFERDMDDEEKILFVLDELVAEVHAEVIANGFKFKTITIRIRYEHFDTKTSSKSLPLDTDDLDILRNNVRRLMAFFPKRKKNVRLIGVRVSILLLIRGD
jgi:DNA polymerase IV (DinB-like DNA polymerase)